MNRATRIYVSAVTAIGTALVSVYAYFEGPGLLGTAGWGFWLLVGAVVVGEMLPIKLGPDEGEVAPSTTFAFALLLSNGIAAAAIAQALGSLVADIADRKSPAKIAFNLAQYTLTITASGLILHLAGALPHHSSLAAAEIPVILAAGGAFFLLNTGLVAVAVSLNTDTRLRDHISGALIKQSATEGILLGIAPLAVLALDYEPLLLPLVALPMVAVRRAGRQAQIAERLAVHDALTGLPNRVLFQSRTEQALHAARRGVGATATVMLLDLDRFKEINDTLGHHYGDEVLREIGRRLPGIIGERDVVARLGGDEFAVLLRSVDAVQAAAIAERIRSAIAEPFDIAGVRLELGASVGIAAFPDHGHDVETLMQRADVAMYQAKERRTGVARYVAELDSNSLQRLSLASDLRGALQRGEFILHYQPKVDLASGVVCGAEVLLRWAHPRHGSIGPGEFIPLAEHTGVILPLTTHVLERALRQSGIWRSRGLELSIAVNLSARTLVEPRLAERVGALCDRFAVPHSSLVLELTESMVVADPTRVIPTLERLQELGVELAIDDFGTGYSSLEYLKLLPVSEIKVDRSFVTSMSEDARDAAIVASTVQLGRSLGMRVVAEGVETAEVMARLGALGCEQGQGFVFSHALEAEAFEAWVAAYRRRERHSPLVALSA